MKYSNLKRFVERNMMSDLIRNGLLNDAPDWLWEAVFELFTYE
jgi:hypothetical protein